MKRLFMLSLLVFSMAAAYTQNIVSAEYFFDADPGCGKGTAITIPASTGTVNFTTDIPSNMLTAGFHLLAVRVRDADGKWSMFDRRGIYISTPTSNTSNITAAEYFYDSDPGPGNGTPVSVGTTGEVVNFAAVIPAPMNTGFHFLAIRTRDADGKWGMFERRGFYISPPPVDMPVITAAEYFYDNDPGVGNGTALAINSPGNSVSQNFMVPVPAQMAAGGHFLAIRVKDQAGNWSLFEKDSLTVGAVSASMSCPGNITVNALADQCEAVVNNLDPVITPQGSAYTYTLTGATTGNGNGSASGHLFNAGTTTVTYSLDTSPGVNCSFTVTVNPGATTSVSIYTPITSICSGSAITFFATPVNGGFTPVYQWKKNGINVGINSNQYTDSTLVNADVITVVMTSSLPCASPVTVTSNPVTMSVTETVTPSVSITASATSICPGQQVSFTATPTNGGNNPTYQWIWNGHFAGSNSTYQSSMLADGDSVFLWFNSSASCLNYSMTRSNVIYITASQSVSPMVSISASATSICPGQQVTFTASPTNGGNTPTFQWKLNGNNVGTNSSSYQNSGLVNGDAVAVEMTSSLSCASPSKDTSNAIIMSVGSTVVPSVSISASATSICAGQPVTFTASPVNGGNTPSFQWKLNGNNVGTNSSSYQNSGLVNGDLISVEMTSSLSCASPSKDTSNVIIMSVGSAVVPSVSISASATSICAGQPVTFTASPVNGGNTPSFQWKLNGNNIGTNSSSYQYSGLANGDLIAVEMTSSLSCASPSTVTSNAINISVGSPVQPTVSISASATSICAGQPVTFTATATNAGTATYQWKLNGLNVGTNSNVYQYSGLANGDEVTVDMISSLSCANPSKATSNAITMSVGSALEPSVTINASAVSVCAGSLVVLSATPTNGGITPNYQWKVNGANVGTGGSTYQSTSFANADVVSVVMTSSLACASPREAVSNSINILVQSRNTYYRDVDGDGYGSSLSGTTEACTLVPGYSLVAGDCNDNDPSVNPGSAEICGNNGDDNCSGTVDENCTTDLPQLALRTYPVKEGDTGQTLIEIKLSLDRPAPLAIQLNYETVNADAIAGLDYIATNGVLTIPAGAISATLPIRVIGDILRESNEHFWLQFSNPVNVNIGSDGRCKFIIIDDDKGKRNQSTTRMDKTVGTDETLKIPTVARANQTWIIPRIEMVENEVLIINVQGQLVNRFVNYRNNIQLGDLSTGIYFYRIRVKERNGQVSYYTGRLLITD